MSNSLEERLKSNSSAFEGLLSLIPAKYYYDDKTQEQWKAKKKSKSQLKQDKKLKLDPEQQDEESGSALEALRRKQAEAQPVVLPGQKSKSEMKQEEAEEEAEEEPAEEEAASDIEIEVEEHGTGEEVEVNVDPEETLGESESIAVIFDDEGNALGSEQQREKQAKTEASSKQPSNESKENKRKKMEELRAKLASGEDQSVEGTKKGTGH